MNTSQPMNFSAALSVLKSGGRLGRLAWKGTGKFVFLVPGSSFKVSREPLLSILGAGTDVDYHPHIDMRLPDGRIVPWVAGQDDILADDWIEI